MKWIKCEERLPETPKTWDESVFEKKHYVVAYHNGHGYSYQEMGWCDGWNCSMNVDGTISRCREIKDIVAWFEIPEFIED